jgi:hypothetical protein
MADQAAGRPDHHRGSSAAGFDRPYTRGVAAQNIVQALAYINWVVLASLAIGAFGLAYLLRQSTDATNGYVGFTAFSAGLLAGLLFFSDQSLPAPVLLKIRDASGLDVPRQVAIVLFAVLALVAAIRMARGGTARWTGLAALLAGVAAETVAAFGWASDILHAVPLLVQFLMLAVVAGGALGSVVLAHWYLVTPKISERPLVLTARLLTAALALQLVMFVTWQVVGTAGGGPLSSFTGSNALLVWLRLIVGLCFPLVLSYLAYRTAQTRSMESATGLLYIDLAAILASTIVAAALVFTAALLV